MGGIESTNDGVFFSVQLDGAKQGQPKLTLLVSEPVKDPITDATTWKHVANRKGISDITLMSVKQGVYTDKATKKESPTVTFYFKSGIESYGMKCYMNSVSRKMLESFLWAMEVGKYDYLSKFSFFVFKGDDIDQETKQIKSKKSRNIIYFETFSGEKDYGRFFDEKRRKELVKTVKDGNKVEYKYGDYDLALLNCIDMLNAWLQETRKTWVEVRGEALKQDLSIAPVAIETKVNDMMEVVADIVAPTNDDDLPF